MTGSICPGFQVVTRAPTCCFLPGGCFSSFVVGPHQGSPDRRKLFPTTSAQDPLRPRSYLIEGFQVTILSCTLFLKCLRYVLILFKFVCVWWGRGVHVSFLQRKKMFLRYIHINCSQAISSLPCFSSHQAGDDPFGSRVICRSNTLSASVDLGQKKYLT